MGYNLDVIYLIFAMAFNSDRAQLHLGILQSRLEKIKGKMRVAMGRVTMAEDPMQDATKLGIDVEMEKLKFAALDKEYGELEEEFIKYEDKVLSLTELSE